MTDLNSTFSAEDFGLSDDDLGEGTTWNITENDPKEVEKQAGAADVIKRKLNESPDIENVEGSSSQSSSYHSCHTTGSTSPVGEMSAENLRHVLQLFSCSLSMILEDTAEADPPKEYELHTFHSAFTDQLEFRLSKKSMCEDNNRLAVLGESAESKQPQTPWSLLKVFNQDNQKNFDLVTARSTPPANDKVSLTLCVDDMQRLRDALQIVTADGSEGWVTVVTPDFSTETTSSPDKSDKPDTSTGHKFSNQPLLEMSKKHLADTEQKAKEEHAKVGLMFELFAKNIGCHVHHASHQLGSVPSPRHKRKLKHLSHRVHGRPKFVGAFKHTESPTHVWAFSDDPETGRKILVPDPPSKLPSMQKKEEPPVQPTQLLATLNAFDFSQRWCESVGAQTAAVELREEDLGVTPCPNFPATWLDRISIFSFPRDSPLFEDFVFDLKVMTTVYIGQLLAEVTYNYVFGRR